MARTINAADAGLSLVIGVDGNIGGALYQHLIAQGRPVIGSTRRAIAQDHSGRLIHLDLAQPAERWEIPVGVRVAYLCAGVAVIDQCRQQPQATWQVNCAGSIALAHRLATQGAKVVYLSTNQVFDGLSPRRRAEEATCPRTEYGRQKAHTEQAILQLGDRGAVVRLTKVLPVGAPLLAGWKASLLRGQSIMPFHDMRMAPVGRQLVVEAVVRAGDHAHQPITQVSGREDITYEQAGRYLARKIGADESLIRPISAQSAGLHPDATPAHTTMETSTLETLGLCAPTPWETMEEALQLADAMRK